MLHLPCTFVARVIIIGGALGIATRSALAGPAAGQAAEHGVSSVVGDRTRAQARQATEEFLTQWRDAWKLSERERHPIGLAAFDDSLGTERMVNVLCSYDGYYSIAKGRAPGLKFSRVLPTQIRSSNTKVAVCPTWYPPDEPGTLDERVGLDAGLLPKHRGGIASARASLVRLLDSVQALLPDDEWITGQLIRFLVDQGDLDDALNATRECRSSAWWCTALSGYVLHRRGEMLEADVAFAKAAQALPAEQRCLWTDIGIFLEWMEREKYRDSFCTQRASHNERLWWLSDPLYSEAGNERRVEHFARKVLILLHSALEHDERYDWNPKRGGDAVRAMMLAYGWPSYAYWGGNDFDRSHRFWINYRFLANARPPFSAPEYTFGRLALVPDNKLMEEPFSSTSRDWAFAAPLGPKRLTWWPREHYAPPYPLVQLADIQVAMLPRQDSVLFAVATDPSQTTEGALLLAGRDSITASLVVTRAPDSIRVVAQRLTAAERHLVIHGLAPPEQALAALEIVPSHAVAAPRAPRKRARFGIDPPPPLSALGDVGIAVSEPVFLKVPGDGAPLSNIPDSALARMHPTTRFAELPKLGIYWESYGVAAHDSVELGIRVERINKSFWRRLGLGKRNEAVTLSWREPQGAERTLTLAGPVPIQPRVLVLDIAGLPPGEYWLEVSVAKLGQPTARNRRRFTLREPQVATR